MSDSSRLAHDLIFDLNAESALAGDLTDTQANTVALASVTLAINELRKEMRGQVAHLRGSLADVLSDVGKAADATAGFTADIAAALVDSDYYDDDEDYGDVVVNQTFPQNVPLFDFGRLKANGFFDEPLLKVV